MRKYKFFKFLFVCILISFSNSSFATPVRVKSLRIWPSPESTRVVFDVNKPVNYELKILAPNKIEILIREGRLEMDISRLSLVSTRINKLENKDEGKDIKFIISLDKPLRPKSFSLPPNQRYGHRLVVDLEEEQDEKERIIALFEADAELQEENEKINTSSDPKIRPSNTVADLNPAKGIPKKIQNYIIAIDAGHGGEDPGAIGRYGTKEKDVALSIAKHLKRLIDQEPKMKAVLIRSGDYYVSLQERVVRARKHKADLFVSIHADAFPDKRAEGASVFTISEKGESSSAARWLADRENRSDLVGGVSLADKNKVLASVLLDLSQTVTKEEGLQAASYVLKSLGSVGSLHKGSVEQAGFAVLKAPDIPSLLVETGFISHPRSEKKLKTTQHQKKIAHAIMMGIRHYFSKKPPQ